MAEQTSQTDRRNPNPAELIAMLEAKFKDSPEKAADELAHAYLANGRPKDAIKVLARFVNGGTNVDRQLLLAQAWFDSFDMDRSATILQEVEKKTNLERNMRAQLLLGQLAYESGKLDEAKRYLKQAYQLDPQSRRAAELLSSLGEEVKVPENEENTVPPLIGFHASTLKPESAASAFLQVLGGLLIAGIIVGVYYWRANERHTANELVVKGSQLITAHDTASLKMAERKFLEALEHDSGNQNAVAALAEVSALLWVDHGVDGAKENTVKYLEMARDDNNEKVERFSGEVLSLYGEGKFDEGEALAIKVLEKGGVSERMYLGLGITERGANKGKIGRDNLRRSYELKTDVPIYALYTGNAYDEDNDDGNASFYWNTAAARNVNYVAAVAAAVVARSRKGEDPARLHKELDRLHGLGDENLGKRDLAAIERARAVVFYQEAKLKDSWAAADRAMALVGPELATLYIRGLAKIASKDVDGGLKDLEAAHNKAPLALRYLYDLVDAYVDSKKFDNALDTLKGVADKLAEDPSYQVRVGDVYLAKGDFNAARATYAHALEMWDEYPEALLGTGKTYWREKKYEEASKWFERAVDARQKFPDVYVAVGFMWAEQNVPIKNANDQLDHAEKLMIGQAYSMARMEKFYASVIEMMNKAKGGVPFAKEWDTRRDTRRKAAAGG